MVLYYLVVYLHMGSVILLLIPPTATQAKDHGHFPPSMLVLLRSMKKSIIRKFSALPCRKSGSTDANAKRCHLHAQACEFDLQCGPHRGYLPSGHPAFGGAAIASEGGSSIPFDTKHDALGTWPSFWVSARVCAQWVAVTPSTTMLFF